MFAIIAIVCVCVRVFACLQIIDNTECFHRFFIFFVFFSNTPIQSTFLTSLRIVFGWQFIATTLGPSHSVFGGISMWRSVYVCRYY